MPRRLLRTTAPVATGTSGTGTPACAPLFPPRTQPLLPVAIAPPTHTKRIPYRD